MIWLVRVSIAGVLATLLAILHWYSPLQLSSVVPYVGLILVATGLVSLIHPLRTIFVRTREAALSLIAAGLIGAALALFWPTSTTTVLERKSLLDAAMPQYEFVGASPGPCARSASRGVLGSAGSHAYPILMKIRSGAMGHRWSKPKGPIARHHCGLLGSGLGLHSDRKVSTETRLRGLDAGSRRGMAVYWRLIYPGSGMLRTMWLQAARTRVEKAR